MERQIQAHRNYTENSLLIESERTWIRGREDQERFFYRSDHYNYARKGIPIIFYFNGPHADYPKPSDSSEKIDFQKMERVGRTVLMTALEIANAANRPLVDKPLNGN